MPGQGIAPAPQEECGGRPSIPPQGPVPVTGVFPAGVYLHLLETGIQAIQLSPYRADLPARRPIRLGTAAGFLACYFPRSPFQGQVSHQIQRHLLSIPARCAGDTTVRLMAHGVCKTVGLAYVGSNPTPATTCGNSPWPAHTRSGVDLVQGRWRTAETGALRPFVVEWWLSGRPLRLLRRDAGGHRRLSSCGALCTRRDHSLVAGRRQRVGMSPATARPWWQPADRGSWRSTAAIRPGSPPPLPCRSPGCGGPSKSATAATCQ